MSDLESINCGGCGAPLEIPTAAIYVTCRFCNCQLHVQRTETVAFTEVIQSLQDKTSQLTSATEAIRLRQEIQQLDYDWDQTKAKLMHRRSEPPSRENAIVIGVVIGVADLAVALTCLVAGSLALAAVVIVVGFLMLILSADEYIDAGEWELKESRYHRKRRRLAAELADLEHPAGESEPAAR